MKNRIVKTVIAMVLVVSTVLFTAGFAMNTNVKEKTFKSKDGWSVNYDPSTIKVINGKHSTSFIYTGDKTGKNMLTISYKKGVAPEKALYDLTAGWGNTADISKGESYFPGTNDKWGLWDTLLSNTQGSGINKNAFAGEFNGGTLIFDFVTVNSSDASANSAVWQILSQISDSATYDSFAPQTMYAGYAGVYTMNGVELINGQRVPVTYTVTLDADHQGTVKLGGDVQYVMWGSHSLIQADNSFDYNTDGHTLNLNVDGNWLTFTK